MQKRVLILTPSPGFGGMIRQLLEDSGDFEAYQFSKFQFARELADKAAVALIVLDAEMGAEASPERIADLREHAPHAKLMLIPAEENPTDPNLSRYKADTVMSSPFYLPDLMAAVEQFFGPIVAKESPKKKSYGDEVPSLHQAMREAVDAPEWLEDVTASARYLTRLSLESASQAALITRGNQVWAYAGELPKEAADELAVAVVSHAANAANSDLARFIHLNATKSDYMLYATALGGDYTLALVFDAQMPFSQMRAQVSQVAKALAAAPVELPRMANSQSEPKAHAQQSGAVRAEHGRGEEPSLEHNGGGPTPAWTGGEPAGRSSSLVASTGDLQFAFMLIPRLPKHKLEGDLASSLATWLPELCLAFAWRLESMSVKPDYLQWSIYIPAGESPEAAARTLDKQLSARIFDEFPRIARDNPSGQFWAPGLMVVSGSAPTPVQVRDHIQNTRARQGVK